LVNVKAILDMDESKVREYFRSLTEEEKLSAFETLVKHSKFYDEEMKALARDCLKDVFVDDSSALYEGYDLPG
jgi:hypothetical protein